MATVLEMQRAYRASVQEIYDRREFLIRKVPAAHGERLKAWVDCAEELAAVTYDVFRYEVQVAACEKPEHLPGLELKLDQLKTRAFGLSKSLPAAEADLREACPQAAERPYPAE